MAENTSNIIDSLCRLDECEADSRLVSYLKSRAVPDTEYSKIYCCENLLNWVTEQNGAGCALSVEKLRYDFNFSEFLANLRNGQPVSYLLSDMSVAQTELNDSFLFFPCFNENKQLSCIIARRAPGACPKEDRYYDIVVSNSSARLPLRGFCDLNHEKTIFAVEGCIDSLYLPNSFSIHGVFSGFALLEDPRFQKLPRDNVIFVLDNEPNLSVLLLLEQRILHSGFKLFVWPNSFAAKDLSEVAASGMTQDELRKLLTSNAITKDSNPQYFHSLKGRIQRAFFLERWMHRFRRIGYYLRHPWELSSLLKRKLGLLEPCSCLSTVCKSPSCCRK